MQNIYIKFHHFKAKLKKIILNFLDITNKDKFLTASRKKNNWLVNKEIEEAKVDGS